MKEIKVLKYKDLTISGPVYLLAPLGLLLFYGVSAVLVSLIQYVTGVL